jgi:hypothetical protein
MSCTGKILIVFGLLLILVILFVPYRSFHVKYKLDSHSLTHYKLTSHQDGYMFVFKFLELKSKGKSVSQSPVPGTDHDSYSLNKTMFLIELMIILVLAPFDYFLFCVIFKKKKL